MVALILHFRPQVRLFPYSAQGVTKWLDEYENDRNYVLWPSQHPHLNSPSMQKHSCKFIHHQQCAVNNIHHPSCMLHRGTAAHLNPAEYFSMSMNVSDVPVYVLFVCKAKPHSFCLILHTLYKVHTEDQLTTSSSDVILVAQ